MTKSEMHNKNLLKSIEKTFTKRGFLKNVVDDFDVGYIFPSGKIFGMPGNHWDYEKIFDGLHVNSIISSGLIFLHGEYYGRKRITTSVLNIRIYGKPTKNQFNSIQTISPKFSFINWDFDSLIRDDEWKDQLSGVGNLKKLIKTLKQYYSI